MAVKFPADLFSIIPLSTFSYEGFNFPGKIIDRDFSCGRTPQGRH